MLTEVFMSVFLNKSEQNLNAATKLIELELNASSIHCSYYSCLQRMLYIKTEKLGEQPETLLKRAKAEDTGSHNIITNEIKQAISSKNSNYSEQQAFSNTLALLKRNRIEADYQPIEINKSKSSASLELAKKINTILARIFK